jgi:hypothetical protein
MLTPLDAPHFPITEPRGAHPAPLALRDSQHRRRTSTLCPFRESDNATSSHVSTTTCLERHGWQALSRCPQSPFISTITSQSHQVSSTLTSTVTIPIGPDVVNGEATFDIVKHGDVDSSDQTSYHGVGAGEQGSTLVAGNNAMKAVPDPAAYLPLVNPLRVHDPSHKSSYLHYTVFSAFPKFGAVL